MDINFLAIGFGTIGLLLLAVFIFSPSVKKIFGVD